MTNQDVLDIKACAFEVGINYWADIKPAVALEPNDPFAGRRDADFNYIGDWIIIERDDEGFLGGARAHILNDENLERGIHMAAKHKGQSIASFVEDGDAGDADIAVQFALLGEIVYG